MSQASAALPDIASPAFAARDWEGGRRRTVARLAHGRVHDHRATLDYIQTVCPRQYSLVEVPWPLVTENIAVAGQRDYDR